MLIDFIPTDKVLANTENNLPFTFEDTLVGVRDKGVSAKKLEITSNSDTSSLFVKDQQLIFLRQELNDETEKGKEVEKNEFIR